MRNTGFSSGDVRLTLRSAGCHIGLSNFLENCCQQCARSRARESTVVSSLLVGGGWFWVKTSERGQGKTERREGTSWRLMFGGVYLKRVAFLEQHVEGLMRPGKITWKVPGVEDCRAANPSVMWLFTRSSVVLDMMCIRPSDPPSAQVQCPYGACSKEWGERGNYLHELQSVRKTQRS